MNNITINIKNSLLVIFFCFSLFSFSQNNQIPNIKFHDEFDETNHYVDLLKLKDKDALIIRLGYVTYSVKGKNSDFIVYLNNGKVKRYEVLESLNYEAKIKVKRKRIKRKDYKYYWNFLNQCAKNKRFELENLKLNIKEKVNEKEGTVAIKVISHGSTYYIGIYQNKKYMMYLTSDPDSYIESKFPGFEERQKFVDLMNDIEYLIKEY